MAPSTPPPPPPEVSNTATSTTTTTRSPFHNPSRPPNPHTMYSPTPSRLPSNPNPNYPQLAPRTPHPHPQDLSQYPYPVASSGRGFISRQVSVPAVRPSQKPTIGFPYLDQGFVRTNNLAPMRVAPVPAAVKGIPFPNPSQLKAGPPSAFISDTNGHSELSDRSKDGVFAIIRDRKVQLSENASLYTLCRSWMRNGFSVDTQQPQYLDPATVLPRPLPRPKQFADLSYRKTVDNESEEETQEKDSCEQLTEKELLQRHIKRAKRIRSRLNEERFRRIERYKSRLALLLAPSDRASTGNDSAPAATSKLQEDHCLTSSSDAERTDNPTL